VSLDLAVLTPDSAKSLRDALDVYYERVQAEPDEYEAELHAFAAELDASYDDENWPFAGDPIRLPTHVQLTFAAEAWEQEVPKIVGAAHRHGLVVLDPQEEHLYPPQDFAVS
jgi:hypothetical protein